MEESTLAHLTRHEELSDIFAWYSLIGNAGTALGMMVCGWIINFLQASKGWQYVPACRVIFFIYAGAGVVKLLLTLCLSKQVEAVPTPKKKNQDQDQNTPSESQPLLRDDQEQPKKPFFALVEKELLSLIIRLAVLFALDSFASGLASM